MTNEEIKSKLENKIMMFGDGEMMFKTSEITVMLNWIDQLSEKLKWIDMNKQEPEEGIEYLLFNEKWINEDYNPKGVRIGFLDGMGGWVSAYYCNTHDEYHTRMSDEDDEQFELLKAEDQIPTHYMIINETSELIH